MDNLRIYLLTYNVGTNSPEQDLRDMFSLNEDHLKSVAPDLFVLGFQEVKAQPQNMLLDSLFEDPWTFAAKQLLRNRDYIKIKSIRLQGLLLVVFSLKKHILNVRDLESEYTRTGLAGMWGNKGAVSIRLNLYGCSLCFINAHLSAHDHQLKNRVQDYNDIIQDQKFHIEETSKILFHDYVFWMGDLNFRLDEEYDKTPEEIERAIIKKDIQSLFEHDQLRSVMRSGEAFSEFCEKDPDFAPTFKFSVGSTSYDYKRKPAWCDRILYCVNSNNYENVTLKADQISYKSHPTYTLSDHRPVSAEFVVKMWPRATARLQQPLSVDQVFADYDERVVEFEKILSWSTESDENKAFYRVTKDMPPTKEDWIGLFKENFCSLDEYVTYEYVSKCVSPTPDGAAAASAASFAAQRFECTFSEIPSRCGRGRYCLVYFSQTEDKVTSVLGISEAFPIVSVDID